MTTTTTQDVHVTEIGAVAGEVWHYLERHGEQTLAQIKKGVPRSADTITMALGWLAREGKIQFVLQGRVKKVALNR